MDIRTECRVISHTSTVRVQSGAVMSVTGVISSVPEVAARGPGGPDNLYGLLHS
jgi:hypothetical protein